MHSRTGFTVFSLILLLLSAAWIAFGPQPTLGVSISAPRAGLLAPDFALDTLAGDSVRLSDLRGDPVIVNVWASWCPPCRSEMPAFERVYREYAGSGLHILAVNAISQDTLENARAFVVEHDLTFPIPLDDANVVLQGYRISAFPSTFFIDREGVIHKVVLGGVSEALLRSQVEELLAGGE
jgi:cytochrome c biogenesis protein CcmG, thiol:disulfide interchange protein DsbE